jgi:hypothetical protein
VTLAGLHGPPFRVRAWVRRVAGAHEQACVIAPPYQIERSIERPGAVHVGTLAPVGTNRCMDHYAAVSAGAVREVATPRSGADERSVAGVPTAKLVIISNNCPPLRKSEIEYYAMLAKTGVHHYTGSACPILRLQALLADTPALAWDEHLLSTGWENTEGYRDRAHAINLVFFVLSLRGLQLQPKGMDGLGGSPS